RLRGQGARDGTEVRPGAGLNDHGRGRSALHGRAEEAEVFELERVRIARVAGRLELLDRQRFAREASLRDEEIPAGENADIGRDHVAGAEVDDVTGDEPGERFLDRGPHAGPSP